MIVLLSPAKRLNEEQKHFFNAAHAPVFHAEAAKVNAALKKLSAKKLMDLQGISADLAAQNRVRNMVFNTQPQGQVYQQALFMFNGDAYLGLDAPTLSPKALDFAQQKLRILSGMYGLLKPLDCIEPYRLEMGTQLKVGNAENLYAFWQKKVTAQLKSEFAEEPIVNLASAEYAKAVQFKSLKNLVINVEFKDRNAAGEYKVMSYFAKRARGLMSRFILENQLENTDDLRTFAEDGYALFAPESNLNKLVFLRDH